MTIGYLTRPQTVTEAKQAWIPAASEMLDAIRDLPGDWVLSTSHGNYASLERTKHPREWSDAELVESLSKPACHLVVERRLQSASVHRRRTGAGDGPVDCRGHQVPAGVAAGAGSSDPRAGIGER